MLPVQNIPEQYLYRLLPQGVINLDTRKLIESVMAGYQDRMSDLRSYISGLNELVKPDALLPQLGFNVVLVTFEGPAGQIITRSLDILPSTPDLDDTAALLTWATAQLDLDDPELVRSAVAGTDLLREIDVDSVSLLANNVGAILYPGLRDGESDAAARRTRQQLLQSHFPRLKIKGTADSFESLGRVLGFDSVAMTPLWSRLVPRIPNDPGAEDNDSDFDARPEQTPAATLPDPRYDPMDYRDGEFFSWSSGTLLDDPESAYFWTTAVNNRNPFIRIIRTASTVTTPEPGRYRLVGGKSNVVPSVLLSADLKAEALVSGASMNGLKIDVVENEDGELSIEITSKLSAVKYRSSYFDIKATLAAASVGTEPAQGSADLEDNPSLTADGTAVVPFRPWGGGSYAQNVVTFPDIDIGARSSVVARAQVTGNGSQLARSEFDAGLRTADNLESMRAATRRIRSRSVGLSIRESAAFASYVSSKTLFEADGDATYSGTVSSESRPSGLADVTFQAFFNGTAVPTYVDVVSGGMAIAGDGFTGAFNSDANSFEIATTGDFSNGGSVIATYIALQGTTVRSEPTQDQKIAGITARQSNPEDAIDLRGTNVSLYDEMPWRRDTLIGGTPVDDDFYYPVEPDASYKKAVVPYRALALSGRQYELAILDSVERIQPFRFKVVQNQEIDPITGEQTTVNYDRLLLAENDAREQFHVLLIDKAVVATQYWSPAKRNKLLQWIPFNEHPLDDVEPFARYSTGNEAEIDHANRLWDTVRGWYLRLEDGNSVAVSSASGLGTLFSFSFWLKLEASGQIAYSQIVAVGSSSLVFELGYDELEDANIRVKALVNGVLTEVTTVTIDTEFIDWVFVAARRNESTLSVGVGTLASPAGWETFDIDLMDEVPTADFLVNCGPVAFGIHDFTAWTEYKSNIEIEAVRNPTPVKTSVAYPTTWTESLSRDSRYIFKLVDSGFAYPAKADVTQVRDVPAYAQRQTWEGLYDADPRFKQVGLGDGNEPESIYQLGLRGRFVDGYGDTLISGSYPALPGYATAWTGTVGQVVSVLPPIISTGGASGIVGYATSPWPQHAHTNTAQDRVYIKGDNDRVYKVFIDDEGSGAVLKAEPVQRERGSLETGTVPQFLDQPTDAVTLLAVPGKRLAVEVVGTDYTPAEIVDVVQTTTTPDFYLYRQTRVYVGALTDAFSRWENPNAFGTDLGVPALSSNGELQFSISESLPAGTYRMSIDAGNIGVVDDNFSGFSVVTSVVNSDGTVLVQQSQPLLPNGEGEDPRGITSFNVSIDSAVTGPWLLRLEWNNSLAVPRKGQKRQLAVYGFEIRLISPALYRISLDPLTLTEVDISDDTTVRPGGLVGRINSYGTLARIDHEATQFHGNSAWPLSNLVTSSTWQRRQTLRVSNPSVEPDPEVPSPPVVEYLAKSGSNFPYYNHGDTVSIYGGVQHGSNVQSYVWRFWDQTVQTTETGTVSKVISPGPTPVQGTVTMTAVDRLGNASSQTLVLPINNPPTLSIEADQNVGIFPYSTTITATTDDLSDSVTVTWFENGVEIGTGLTLTHTITGQTGVTARAEDARGGVTSRTLAFYGNTRKAPVVSPIIRKDIGRISLTNTLDFAVYAIDPNDGGSLSFLWSFWNNNADGIYLTGYDDDGIRINDNTEDPHYEIVDNSVDPSHNGPAIALAGLPGYIVAPAAGLDGINPDRPAGTYDFKTTFNIPVGTDLSTVSLVVSGTADDSADVYVNDDLVAASGLVNNLLQTVVINSGNATFVVGTNTIVFRVTNVIDSSPSFLNITEFYGTTSTSGTSDVVEDSNVKFNQATKLLAGSTEGEKIVQVVVTDSAGLSTTVRTAILLVANTPPTIVEITTPSTGALAGTEVRYGAKVVDADEDTISYTWDFTSPRVEQLLGGNVKYATTTPDDVGLTIEGTLTVTDGNGGSVTQALPSVIITDAFIGPIVLKVVPGFYSSGFVQEISSSEADVEFRYTLDGTDVKLVTDGIEYVGPFMMLPPTGGVGTTTIKVRAFKDDFAPTEQLVAVFEFYNPNQPATFSDPDIGEGVTAIVNVRSTGDTTISTETGAGIPGDAGNLGPTTLQDSVPEVSFEDEVALPFSPVSSTSTVVNGGAAANTNHIFVKLARPI